VTLHRPSNVDHPDVLRGVLEALQAVAVDVPLIFPLHPRAALMLKTFGFERYLKRGSRVEGIWVTERWVISHFCT
jgi:UDP-N-acetylglucosamine 2-epimerase (non-hydrolysing)